MNSLFTLLFHFVQFLIEKEWLRLDIKLKNKQNHCKSNNFTLQGGVNSPITMTAYVLIALSETDFANDNLVRTNIQIGMYSTTIVVSIIFPCFLKVA